MKRFLIFFVCSLSMGIPAFRSAEAEVRLPEIFGSGMVLQRDMEIPVWGWADPGEEITVHLEDQRQTTVAGTDGSWLLSLPQRPAGGPYRLTAEGKNRLVLENVLVGDVWLCSGQSNMDWKMEQFPDSKAEIPSIDNPRIRLFRVQRNWSPTPKDSLSASWQTCNPETVASFSAVAYYFGAELNEKLDIPIGLINASWGGTRIEPWTPTIGFESVPALRETVERIELQNPETEIHKKTASQALDRHRAWLQTMDANFSGARSLIAPPEFPSSLIPFADHQKPTVLFNAMIHPFSRAAIKGVIWYQGEANRGEGMIYAEKMKALISGWRAIFRNEILPFYYVQLAPYDYGGDVEMLPKLWEAQASVAKAVPNTGMAVINDIGNLKNIHPANKKTVGRRLAALALHGTYRQTDVACFSPELKTMTVDGKTAVLDFLHAKELTTRDGKAPEGFELAGPDGNFRRAEATIDRTTIRLTSPAVNDPVAVRFAWSMFARPNVQNEARLPLGAFRLGSVSDCGPFESLVPEAKDFRLLYRFDPTSPVMADKQRLQYHLDRSGEISGKIKRVGYFLWLKPKNQSPQYVFVTMPSLSDDPVKLGVPTKSSGARFQQKVSDVTIRSNVPGVPVGTFAEGCNVEFWDCSYDTSNGIGIPGASDSTYDFGDKTRVSASPGFGSMQIHHYEKKQTIFAFNAFVKGRSCDIGIGNCPKGSNPDWTHSKSGDDYESGLFLILVEMLGK